MYFSSYILHPPKRGREEGLSLSKGRDNGPNPARTRRGGQGCYPSRHRGTQPLTRPNRGRTHRGGNGREKNFALSLYCVSGSDMRQGLCSASFRAIGPWAAQSRPGFLPTKSAWLPTASQALCLSHLGDRSGYISASRSCFKDRICSSVVPIYPLTQMDRFWMAPGIYASSWLMQT